MQTRSVAVFPMPWAQPRPSQRFEGEVFVLVNRHSYSNTVTVAAIVQDFGFGKVIDEPTADLASTLSAMERFTLPHTGIDVGYPKARILRPNGGPRPSGVTPDIMIDMPIVGDIEDTVLQHALGAIGQRR
ncbi:MAG: S41 family peptidase [Lysobacteraceae bacterium]